MMSTGKSTAMSTGKSKQLTTSKLVVILLGITCLYQVAYHFIVFRALPSISNDFDELNEHCSRDSKSLQCTELLVFQRWHDADIGRGVEVESGSQLEMLVHDVAPKHRETVPNDVPLADAPVQQKFLGPSTENSSYLDKPYDRTAFDKLYEETLAKLHKHDNETYHSPFEQDFEVLQNRYKEHEQRLHDIHAKHHHPDVETSSSDAGSGDGLTHEARMAKFEKLYEDSMASLHAHENEPTDFQKEISGELEALQAGLNKRMNRSHHHVAPTTTAAPHVDTLMEKIQSFGHELCEVPEHRRLAACAQFLAPAEVAQADKPLASDAAARHAMRVAQRKRIHDELEQWDATFAEHDHHLCTDSRHRNSSHCQQLRETGQLDNIPEPSTPPTVEVHNTSSKKFLAASDDLLWSEVVSAGAKTWSRDEKKAGLIAYNSTDLRHLRFGQRWGGKIPKVACVAPIPCSHSARAHMSYFIDNFKLQQYEGEKELLLVYRHQDEAVEAIVKAYANGKDIKAVPAFDGGEFPSATAFRYASWTAKDADIIARWNYDEWFGPERLSMQVRALAASKRPASLLKYWTVLAGAGKELMSTHGGPGWEGSIVGEKGWMNKHWMPMMEGERALLMDHYSHDIVQVDKPDLLVYNAETNHSVDTLRHFVIPKQDWDKSA